MPTYEYVCRACGHEFERFQKMTEDPIRVCPECEEPRVERLISSGGGIVFKGPGFYATDYRKAPPSGGEKESGDAGAKSEASAGKKDSSGSSGGSARDAGSSGGDA
ncbi:MAG: FmdB family zinc ribbon protein [Gemmatimonadota bacterium]|nr:FmdB family zinc ribbon protein [Gemmatimonadota bacterium]